MSVLSAPTSGLSPRRRIQRVLGWAAVQFGRGHKEHFDVFLHDRRTSQTRMLASPRDGYLADPFLLERGGRTWLFLEHFERRVERGRLVVAPVSGLTAGEPKPLRFEGGALADASIHASFPFVFATRDRVLMIPETRAARAIDLYECTDWPLVWRHRRRLLDDVEAVDTMALHHCGLWWLFSSTRSREGGLGFALHSTEDLFKGALVPHPVTGRRLDAGGPHGSGRNAGLVGETEDGRLFRLVQDSRRRYGEGIALRFIVGLDRERYEERPEPLAALPVLVAAGASAHHVSVAGPLVAFDRRYHPLSGSA